MLGNKLEREPALRKEIVTVTYHGLWELMVIAIPAQRHPTDLSPPLLPPLQPKVTMKNVLTNWASYSAKEAKISRIPRDPKGPGLSSLRSRDVLSRHHSKCPPNPAGR